MSDRPSELEDHLGYWLRRLSNRVSRGFSERLERRGATVPQWVAMRCLHDVEGASLLALASTMGIDGGATSRLVERLVRKGWVAREADANDRRAVVVRLTDAGRALVPELAREADENDAAFFEVVGEAERRRLLATLKKLLAKHEAGDDARSKTID
jgi:DNA-binding MarR family transcriptional regulator